MRLTEVINISSCIRCIALFILIYCFSSQPFALPINQGHVDLSGEVGLTQLSTKNTLLQVTPIETDTLQQKNNSFTSPLLGVGIGYAFPLHPKSNGMNWLPYFKPMVNLRYQQQALKGPVYQFQDPEFYNYNYTISVVSTRLMLDFALGLFTYKDFSGYVLGGFGATWNRISYHDQATPGVLGGMLVLNNHLNAKFIPEAGGGVSYGLNEKLTLSLEYLYAHFGSNQLSANGTLNGFPTTISPSGVPITSQSVHFILIYSVL